MHRAKYLLGLTLLPLFVGTVVVCIIILADLRTMLQSDGFVNLVAIIISIVFLGTAAALVVIYKAGVAVKRVARYTFFDIGEQELIYSKYGGEKIRNGERIITRELYVIPIAKLIAAETLPRGDLRLVCEPESIRQYSDQSKYLGYHFKEDGKLDFDMWFSNYHGFTLRETLEIPACFERQRMLRQAVLDAKERFSSRAVKQPYVHKESEVVLRRKRQRELERERRWEL